ncbi:SNF2 helicase associated domain-containing protein [Clostridium sp. CM027]|uniref:DEAD/DEAH box helicase n=1 Tax=Clostridium sp. CM027 TaxID=2849865 RepID=UPI001C6EBD1F|nr:SNF2-related protein [Clostridium sp. CM027]MBW9145375.1 SNF2 helicase associated domain-containing protein [Clostridium sp. CM027]UVE42513.1 SNF2 helicase associated domain-containing protein [Clostridium sp. CM027]
MKLKELENIVFKSSSELMRSEGENAFNSGLVIKIKGKKIENIYHIYGRVKSDTQWSELNTHIKIDLLKKKLDGIKCTCEDFKTASNVGYLFMCSHLTATAYSFFSITAKKKCEKNEKTEKLKEDNSNNQGSESIIKLVRKVSKGPTYYEAQYAIGKEKIKIEPKDLRTFLTGTNHKKIKLNYDSFEFEAPIVLKDLPLNFTLKIRNEYFVLTTHRQFPVSLNDKNDVYLFNWKLYIPSKNQVRKYVALCEKLKKNGEILYPGGIENYNKIISFLSSISNNINISEEIRDFAANFIKPEFHIYEIDSDIYCDIEVIYGNDKINILKKDKSKNIITRNYKKEDKILMELEKYRFIKRNEKLLFIGSDEQLFDILSKSEKNLHSLGDVTFGKGIKDRKIYDFTAIEAEIKEKDGYYDFSYGIHDIENKELNSVLSSFKQKRRFYKTNNNNFLDFKDAGVKNFFDLIEVFNINKKIENGLMHMDKGKALYLNEKMKNKGIQFVKGTEVLNDIENALLDINNIDIRVPMNLKATLREYQIDGFKWLKSLSRLGFGGILADEMGLGKTIQTIALLLSEENKKSIIISPTSLIYNWKAELERFSPSLNVAIVHGEKSRRLKLIHSLEEYDIILTTYGTLRTDIGLYEDISFDYCIIDEAQNIKNHLAQNTKVIKEVKAKVRFALTGTPIENNLIELWSIFDFIMPDYLYSKEIFESKFIINKEGDLEELKLLIKPFLLRRTKKEVLKELPDKIEKKFIVEMTSVQKAVYKSYTKVVRDKMKNNNGDDKIEIFSCLTKLRQICLDPSLVIDEYKGGSGKLKIATELIEKHMETYGKVLLFSQFTAVLKNIGENLNEKGIRYLYLEGKTKAKDRIKLVDEFNNSCESLVFLISLKAGGTGLNLTSANLVIHFDPWWNPAVENQATDRAHRIGQKNVVEVIKLVTKGTIEEKIILLQENKKHLIDSVITGELTSSDILGKLTKKELLEIFRF